MMKQKKKHYYIYPFLIKTILDEEKEKNYIIFDKMISLDMTVMMV